MELEQLTAAELARLIGAVEGRRPGKVRSRAYGRERVRRGLARSGMGLVEAAARAGIGPPPTLDELLNPPAAELRVLLNLA